MEHSNPLDILRHGHQEGLAILEQLVDALNELKSGERKAAKDKLEGVFHFFNKELPIHFRQEEEALFPALEKPLSEPGPVKVHGETPDICYLLFCDVTCSATGPLAIYRREHQNVWLCIDRLNDVAHQTFDSGVLGDSVILQMELAVTELECLLRAHIVKENEALLPKAEEVLNHKLQIEIGYAMERIYLSGNMNIALIRAV